MKRQRGRPPHADLLTPSEWRTVHFVQHGMSNVDIAKRRGISVNAVKFHVGNALSKLRLRNRRELRAWLGDFQPDRFDPKAVIFVDPKEAFEQLGG